jgi:hypothetical protein
VKQSLNDEKCVYQNADDSMPFNIPSAVDRRHGQTFKLSCARGFYSPNAIAKTPALNAGAID